MKFPVDNYLRHLEATTDAERDTHAKAFLRDVRGRVKELAARTGYIDADTTLDEVLLFIPNESVWAFIHERDPQLIDVALGQKVVLCSPVSLFAVLAVIRQAVEQTQLARTSNEILECLAGFGKEWTKFSEGSTRSSASSTPRSGASKTSAAPAAASSSASSTASRRSGPRAACPTPRRPPSATATRRPGVAPAATSASGTSPKPAEPGGDEAAYGAGDSPSGGHTRRSGSGALMIATSLPSGSATIA